MMEELMSDLISRQATLELLGDEPEVWTNSDYELGAKNQYLFDRLVIETVPSAEPQWIPTSERLPEGDGRYLITNNVFGTPVVEVLGYADDLSKMDDWKYQAGKDSGWYFVDSEYGIVKVDSVTAWMPFPKPYKEGEQK